jgi:glycosyltransferase involved in cell wall biosynthesis
LEQVARRLSTTRYDVVIVSQPFAYLVYERLAPRYPGTLFLNRTHGWEARLYAAQRRLGFAEARGAAARMLSGLSEQLTRIACRRTALASHSVICPASLCASYIRSAYGLPPSRAPVIPYGLDKRALQLAAQHLPRTGGRRMLFIGNYLRRKGSHVLEQLLPRIASEFPDAFLTFVVDQAALPLLEARYRPAFGSRLRVLTWMTRERLEAVDAARDVLLFPSLFEGFGKAWLEGMAAGLCVVGFGEGGLPDLARNGEEAWWCAPGDVSGLAALLRRALSDPQQAATIGRRAQERVLAFSWERTAEETIAHCQHLRSALAPRTAGDGHS